MDKKFYLFFNGEQSGPFSLVEIKSKVHAGEITESAYYWREGLADWQPIKSILPVNTHSKSVFKKIPWKHTLIISALIAIACGIWSGMKYHIYSQREYLIGRIYDNFGEQAEAVEHYKKGAEQGESYAENAYGVCLSGGIGTTKDMSVGLEWIEKSATQGNEKGQCNLGLYYLNGDGISKDEDTGLFWLKKSAERGYAQAQTVLGNYYANINDEKPKDKVEGLKWLSKAAEQGYAPAQEMLAIRYACFDKNNEELAFKYASAVAKQGGEIGASGQFLLGYFYFTGNSVVKKRDYKKAVKWFTKSAKQNNMGSQLFLGKCYLDGTGVNQNSTTASELFFSAAKQGSAEAQFALAQMYEKGEGLVQDKKKAIELYRQIIERKNSQFIAGNEVETIAECQQHLNLLMSEETTERGNTSVSSVVNTDLVSRYKINFDKLLEKAEQGDMDAQYSIGLIYYEGAAPNMGDKSIVHAEAVAFGWWQKAAEQGNTDAQLWLGWRYYDGYFDVDTKNVIQDLNVAVDWWRKAAEQGNANAQFFLGLMYYQGEGVSKDLAASVEWLQKASDQGKVRARIYLGQGNQGEESNYSKNMISEEWWRTFAEQNDAFAQYMLGSVYFDDENYTEAIKWYYKSANQGYAYAQYKLGLLYDSGGAGVAKDDTEAIKWYLASAKQGNAEAQLSLGRKYYNGDGVPRDLSVAVEWLQKAASQGNKEAKQYLNGNN